MIKYMICSDHPAIDEKALHEKTKWVDDMFHIIEEKNLENEQRNFNVGRNVTISAGIFDGDVTIMHLFRRTDDNRGMFIQIIEEPSGLHLHSESLEFTYE